MKYHDIMTETNNSENTQSTIAERLRLLIVTMRKSQAEFAKLISGMGAQPGKPTDQGYIFTATEAGGIFCIARYDLSDPELAGYAVTVPDSDIKE